MENFQSDLYGPYRNCTGQVWYVHWFPSWKVSFGPKRQSCTVLGSMLTEIWVFVWEIAIIAMENFQSDLYGRTGTVQGQVWYVHWFPSSNVFFWSKRQSCTVLGSMLTEIWVFCMGNSYNSYGELSKWPVRPYRNCTGQVWYVHWFPSWKVSFGPKRQSCTVLGSMLTEIWVFVWEIAIIAMENFQSDLYGRTGIVQVKSGMSIWFPSWKGVFWSQTAELYSPWEVC